MSVGWWQILLVLVVLLLLFGRRLPEVARNLGQSITHFKRGMSEVKDEIEAEGAKQLSDKSAKSEKPAAPSAPPPAEQVKADEAPSGEKPTA